MSSINADKLCRVDASSKGEFLKELALLVEESRAAQNEFPEIDVRFTGLELAKPQMHGDIEEYGCIF